MGGFAWPLVVLVLGLVAIFAFKKPLERLIDRTQKVGKGGLEAGQSIQAAATQSVASPADELLKEFDNALLLKREAQVQEHLDKVGVRDTGERERVLVRYLAAASLVSTFESAYAKIWGSQIGVLQLLNSAGPEGTEREFFRPLFEQAAAREPDAYSGDTLDRWLGFLEASSLAVRTGENIAITPEGREFLKYVIHQGYTLYKRG